LRVAKIGEHDATILKVRRAEATGLRETIRTIEAKRR
jgi:hypothetical protein